MFASPHTPFKTKDLRDCASVMLFRWSWNVNLQPLNRPSTLMQTPKTPEIYHLPSLNSINAAQPCLRAGCLLTRHRLGLCTQQSASSPQDSQGQWVQPAGAPTGHPCGPQRIGPSFKYTVNSLGKLLMRVTWRNHRKEWSVHRPTTVRCLCWKGRRRK